MVATVQKQYFGKRLYFLNKAVKQLQAEASQDESNTELRERIRFLYELKTKVLLKLLSEGKVSAFELKVDGASWFSFQYNNMFAFHMPFTKEIRKAVIESWKARRKQSYQEKTESEGT